MQTTLHHYFDEAWRMRAALAQNPDDHALRYDLACLCYRLGYYLESADLFGRLPAEVAARPNVVLEHGLACRRAGLVKEGLALLLAAKAKTPEDRNLDTLLGSTYAELNDAARAVEHFKKAISGAPEDPLLWHGLCSLVLDRVYELEDQEFTKLQSLLQRRGYDDRRLSALHFSLAYVLHARGEYDSAFPHFRRANDLKYLTHHPLARFDYRAEAARLDTLKNIVEKYPLTIPRPTDEKTHDPVPVFIVGMQRSGTTLVESILAAHEAVSPRGEVTKIEYLARDLFRHLTSRDYPHWLSHVTPDILGAGRDAYLAHLLTTGPASSRITDKMPSNFEFLGVIAALFPKSPVIHISREPMDVIWSCYQRNLGNTFANRFDDLIDRFKLYRAYMDFWRLALPVPPLEIEYRELVEQPERVSRRMIDYIGLPWSERCLSFQETPQSVVTASRFQVRQPVHRRALGGWRHYERHLTIVQERLEKAGLTKPLPQALSAAFR